MPEFSEFNITKLSDVSSTPLLFSEDAFVFDGTKAGGDVQPYMEWKLKEVLISGVIENGDTAVDPSNPNVDLSASGDDGGIIIDFFPTETIRPAGDEGGQTVQKLSGIWGGSGSEAYLDDGGIIIEGGFPTETIRTIEGFELLI